MVAEHFYHWLLEVIAVRELPSPVAEMALVPMTGSLNVAELLGLRWRWLNLTGELVVVDTELLHPYTLAVRQSYYRGHFGSASRSAWLCLTARRRWAIRMSG